MMEFTFNTKSCALLNPLWPKIALENLYLYQAKRLVKPPIAKVIPPEIIEMLHLRQFFMYYFLT